jgi:hypothetical protein
VKTRTTETTLTRNRTVRAIHESEAKAGKPCPVAKQILGSCALWSDLDDEGLKKAVMRTKGVVSVEINRY